MRIRTKLSLTFLFTVVLLTSLLTYAVISKTLEKSDQDFVHHAQQEMRLVDDAYEAFFDSVTTDVTYLAQDSIFARIDQPLSTYMDDVPNRTDATKVGGVEAEIEAYLDRFARARPHLVDIYFGAVDGGFVAVTNAAAINYDPRRRPWYVAALHDPTAPVVTDAYQGAGTELEPMLSVATQIKNTDGSLMGVLAADVTLIQLTELVKSVRLGTSGYMLLLDDKGNVLCDPSNDDNLFKNVADIDQPMYKALEFSSTQSFKAEASGRMRLVSTLLSERSGWRLVAVVDTTEIFENQLPLIFSILVFAAVAAAVFLALGTYIATRITSPIVHVTQNLQQIAEGDADLTEEIKITSNDEIGELAMWFNKFLISARQKQIEILRAQKLEAIGQLAAGIAHEINTPTQYVSDNVSFLSGAIDDLRPVLESHLELIDEKYEANGHRLDLESHRKIVADADVGYLLEEMPSALSQSRDGLAQVAKIVLAMKNFSHPGDELASVDINQAIENTVTVARNEWKFVADMELDLDSEIPFVKCVPSAINQVILNMVVNAAQAIGEVIDGQEGSKGTISVKTQATDGFVAVTISDTGCGIADENRERVFEQFFTTKEVGEGTGQGLAMSYDIVVNRHAGSVSVESELGVGSRFTVRLPVDAAANDESEPAKNIEKSRATL